MGCWRCLAFFTFIICSFFVDFLFENVWFCLVLGILFGINRIVCRWQNETKIQKIVFWIELDYGEAKELFSNSEISDTKINSWGLVMEKWSSCLIFGLRIIWKIRHERSWYLISSPFHNKMIKINLKFIAFFLINFHLYSTCFVLFFFFPFVLWCVWSYCSDWVFCIFSLAFAWLLTCFDMFQIGFWQDRSWVEGVYKRDLHFYFTFTSLRSMDNSKTWTKWQFGWHFFSSENVSS